MKEKLGQMKVDKKGRKEATEQLQKLVDTTIQKGLQDISGLLYKKYNKIKDKGRANEIRNSIGISLKKIASRIDHGWDIETQMGKLPPPLEPEIEGEEPPQEDKSMLAMREAFDEISEAHREQVELVREGEPILSLPAPLNHNDEEDGKS